MCFRFLVATVFYNSSHHKLSYVVIAKYLQMAYCKKVCIFLLLYVSCELASTLFYLCSTCCFFPESSLQPFSGTGHLWGETLGRVVEKTFRSSSAFCQDGTADIFLLSCYAALSHMVQSGWRATSTFLLWGGGYVQILRNNSSLLLLLKSSVLCFIKSFLERYHTRNHWSLMTCPRYLWSSFLHFTRSLVKCHIIRELDLVPQSRSS